MIASGAVHDRELLDTLEKLPPEPFCGASWRTTWAHRDPLVGSTEGGRWHPAGSFEALYTSCSADGSLAEAYYHLSQAPIFSSAAMQLNRLKVSTSRIIRLTNEELLIKLGIEDPLAARLDQVKSQAIGAAVHFLEFHGVLVPSARWKCHNLVLFLDRLDLNTALAVEEQQDVNWPAWNEKSLALR